MAKRPDFWDVIVVGAGAGGAAASLGLTGLRVLMLDVGQDRPSSPQLPDEPLGVGRQLGRELAPIVLGESFESVRVINGEDISPKLKGPFMRYLLERPEQLPSDEELGFKSLQSFAKGGLGNAWGAGALRYSRNDLVGFPITKESLEPYYDILADHIGLNGDPQDDLDWYFGIDKNLQPPFPLSTLCARFLARYKKRSKSYNDAGIFVGRLRSAVLSEEHRGRPPFRSFGYDFFVAPQPGIYSPAFTINELIESKAITYSPRILVRTFEEILGGVAVHGTLLSDNSTVTHYGKTLILAAGAINSARITLESHRDLTTRLPILDNPVTFMPFIDVGLIGSIMPPQQYVGAELALVHATENNYRPIQGSLYSLGGPMRSDLLREFPLSLRGRLTASRHLVPALGMLQLFYPDGPRHDSYLQLLSDGSLRIVSKSRPHRPYEQEIARLLRRLGYVALARWGLSPTAGSSIHYAGTLPMRSAPKFQYETDISGLLYGTQRVFLADAAFFPSLPAKNHTFTLMANALRIAHGIRAALTTGSHLPNLQANNVRTI